METKNTTPYYILAKQINDPIRKSRVYPIIELYFKVNQLKQLFRQGWLKKGRDIPRECCESVADHSFGTIVLAVAFHDLARFDLDLLRVLLMLVVHEFGEAGSFGDATPSDNVSPEEKHARERECVVDILMGMHDKQKYLALWDEFEEGKTPEAKFAKEIDILERTLQARIYEIQHGKDLGEFMTEAFVKLARDPYYSEFILRLTAVV